MTAPVRHAGSAIHPEGRRPLIWLAIIVLTVVLGTAKRTRGNGLWWAFSCCLTVYALLAQFFRHPGCTTPGDQDLIVSPAYGRIVHVGGEEEGEVLCDRRFRVSIFLSLFDPHLTRSPIQGHITYQRYHPGRYLVALHPKSSTLNERSSLLIESDSQQKVLVRQIAGFLARRICTYAKKGSVLSAGQEIGFIKLGSRVDLFLPLDCHMLVTVGQHVRAGVTPIARFNSVKG